MIALLRPRRNVVGVPMERSATLLQLLRPRPLPTLLAVAAFLAALALAATVAPAAAQTPSIWTPRSGERRARRLGLAVRPGS